MNKSFSFSVITILLIMLFVLLSLPSQSARAQSSVMLDAAATGNVDVLQAEIEKGNYADAPDSNQVTPLMIACKNGHVQAVTFLLDRGAALYTQDKDGNYPIHYAAMTSNPSIMEKLISLDAEPTVQNAAGQTAEALALQTGNTETAKVIADAAFKASFNDINWAEEAMKIISDPNRILADINSRPEIAPGLQSLQKAFRQEESAWLSRRVSQPTRLAKTVQKQVLQEFKFVIDTAKSENDTRTIETAKEISSLWDRRFTLATEKLAEQSRPERPENRRPSSRNTQTNTESELPIESEKDTELLQEMSDWTSSSGDNRGVLCNTVNMKYLEDMAYIHTIAKHGNLVNTVMVIESLMLSRNSNTAMIAAKIEERRQRNTAIDNSSGINEQDQGRGRRRR